MTYDILIKSGTVLDGAGKTPVNADIGISGEKIEAIGKLSGVQGKIIIDASGKYVTPGFIDITNHSDTHLTLFKYPTAESLLMQGITTSIGGNCGSSLAPFTSPVAIQSIKKWADLSEINVNWTRMSEFLNAVEAFRPGVNFGTLVGHGTLRRDIIGDETRPLTPPEKAQVAVLLEQSLREGAFGFSLGLGYGHERISTTDEIIELASVLRTSGGFIKAHLRSEGLDLLASVNEIVRIGREISIPVHINHFKAIGRKSWRLFDKALELVEHARETNLDITYDTTPYASTGSLLYMLIPGWVREGGFAQLFPRLKDVDQRKKITEELSSLTLHYDRILITSAKIKTIVGKTLKIIAEEAALLPEHALMDTILANEGRVSVIGKTISVQNTEKALAVPHALIASDGSGYSQRELQSENLVHPRSFGAFPHFWHQAVEKLKLAPEHAIWKMTGGPAQRLGLKNRGVLAKGNAADIAIFNPKLFRDRATYKNPFRYPAGINWVIVNGKIAVDTGKITGARAGKVLRKT